jgi:hypothetical protein
MAQPPKRRPWLFPATLTLLIALSIWSTRAVPGSSVLVYKIASDTERLDAPRMKDYWTLHLHLDAQVPAPGPRWVVDDSAQAGIGHELCWLPEKLGLQLYRSSDDCLLGAVRLTQMPQAIDLVRRGSWFSLRIDGVEAMACLDPLATGNDPGASGAWFSQISPGRMGDATITILDDGGTQGDKALMQAELTAVESMRQLLSLGDSDSYGTIEQHLSTAASAMQQLPLGSQLHRRLRHYLALAVVRTALASEDNDAPQLASEAIDQLTLLEATDPIPEAMGMLMSLLPDLANHACSRPAVPEVAENLLRLHQAWMGVLSGASRAAVEAAGSTIGEDQLYQLRLLAHAAYCLQHASVNSSMSGEADTHSSPRPLPAEAPAWVAARWRAFAGDDPGMPTLPEAPQDVKHGPVSIALETLLQDAVIEPAAAVTMSVHLRQLLTPDIMQALAAPDQPRNAGILNRANDLATSYYQMGPYREAALARAVLALRGLGSVDTACQALTSTYGESTPLAQRDPLAYALLSLLVHQEPSLTNLVPRQLLALDRQAHDPDDPLTILSRRGALKLPQDMRELANYEPLLGGGADATAQIWHLASDALPPAQALASALAMEAVLAQSDARHHSPPVNWALLLRMSSYTVPLELLVRPSTLANPAEHLGETPEVLP